MFRSLLTLAVLSLTARAHAYRGNCVVYQEDTFERPSNEVHFTFNVPQESTSINVPVAMPDESYGFKFTNFFYPQRQANHPNGLLQLVIEKSFFSEDGRVSRLKTIYAGDLATQGRTRGRVITHDDVDAGYLVYDCNVVY